MTDAEHPLAAELRARAKGNATDATHALMLQAAATLTQQMQTIQSQDNERGQMGLRLEAMAREVERLKTENAGLREAGRWLAGAPSKPAHDLPPIPIGAALAEGGKGE